MITYDEILHREAKIAESSCQVVGIAKAVCIIRKMGEPIDHVLDKLEEAIDDHEKLLGRNPKVEATQ